MFSIPSNNKPQLGVRINPYHPLSSGLIAAYAFNEGQGDVLNNLAPTGSKFDATVFGPNVSWQPTQAGIGLNFTPTGSGRVEIPPSIFTNVNAVTATYLVNINGLGASKYGRYNDSSPAKFAVHVDASDVITALFVNGVRCTFRTPSVYGWHAISAIWQSGSFWCLYFDGIRYDTTVSPPSGPLTLTNTMYLGNTDNGNRAFDGSFAYVSYHDRALSEQEIRSLHGNVWQTFDVPGFLVSRVNAGFRRNFLAALGSGLPPSHLA